MRDSQELYNRAKLRIPGGTQLVTKRPEMHLPGQWPTYYSKAKGITVWGIDGKKYTDMSYMGIGSCILGYANEDVNKAVMEAVTSGSMSTLNCPEEVELADLLCELHPWADMVRYARTGGESMAIAVRIARAKTKKDKVIFCGYHGWTDWYLSANLGEFDALDGHLLPGLKAAGVPRCLRGTSIPFHYNRIDELKAIVAEHKNDIAAIVMEPIRSDVPQTGFLEEVRDIASNINAVLVFDEITVGWRLAVGGAHLLYNVTPDIAVFAKGMSNGYPMAAIIGTEDVMQATQDCFISSTYWTEKIGLVAALATIGVIRKHNIPRRLIFIGKQVKVGWGTIARKNGLEITVSGIAPLGHFTFDYDNAQAIKTLFTQEMLKRGFLATNAFYASYAHSNDAIDFYLDAIDEVFAYITEAIDGGKVEKLLNGPIAHSGFSRLI